MKIDVDTLQDWALVGVALASGWVVLKSFQTGKNIIDQAAEGVSIIGAWLNEPVRNVWRDLTRGGVETTADGEAVDRALSEKFGEDWQEQLEPWDESLANRMRAHLIREGLRDPIRPEEERRELERKYGPDWRTVPEWQKEAHLRIVGIGE